MSSERNLETTKSELFLTTFKISNQKELALVLKEVQRLYVTAWLIDLGRVFEAEEYQNTLNPKYESECGIRINRTLKGTDLNLQNYSLSLLTPLHHSPFIMRLVQLAFDENLNNPRSKNQPL